MNWSSRLFFFAFLAFLVYVFAIGDQAKWLALFGKQASNTLPPVNNVAQTQGFQ